MVRHVLLLLGLSAAITGCTVYPEKHVSQWSAATGGEHFDRLLWEDAKAKRFANIEQHLAPAFVATIPGGVRNRSAFIDYLKGLQVTDYSITDVSSAPAGGDIVVTYTMTLHGSQAGQQLPETPMTVMTVWQQVTKGYVAISHSEVPRSGP